MVATAVGDAVLALGTIRWVLRRSVDLLLPDSRFLLWNSVLAITPAWFAIALFDAPRRTRRWWCGAVLFVLFLPNAPYVLTDGVHLLDHVRDGASNLAVFGVLVPAYAAFTALGMGVYVLCVGRARDYVSAQWGRRAALVVVLTLHALSAVGIYLGRIVRLNSWDAITSPHSVAASLQQLTTRLPELVVGVTFVALVVLTMLTEACIDGIRARWHEHRLL